MEVRGFEFVANPDQADMLLNVHTHVADQLRVRSVPDPWMGSSYWNHRRGWYQPWPGHTRWPAPSRVEVDQFSEGRLNVDLIRNGIGHSGGEHFLDFWLLDQRPNRLDVSFSVV